MTILNNFLKTYTDRKYQYTVQVNHKGTVIALAMDELRRIYYSVLDLENTQIQGKSPLDVNYWLDNPKEISFPNEIAQVGYAILPNVKMGLIKKGTREEAKLGTLRPEEVDPFLSTTARFTAQAPFQVLSDGKFIYVFRQAIGKEHSDMLYKKDGAGNFVLDKAQQKVPLVNETLLVDRYVLAGTELKLKMEVRYQRSRHKYNPQTSKDGLGAKDLEKKPFFEPTQELDFVRNLKDGRFSVLLLPTQIADLQRWQLFTHNSKTGLIDCFNVERSSDGLFNTKGTQLYTSPDPEYQNSVLERQPGTDSFTGEPLIPVISQSGYAESALDFDGQDDYVQLPALPENLFQTFTIETWVYYRSFSPYSRIFDFGNGASSDNILLLADASGKTSFGIFIGGSGNYVEVHNILEINKWIHLAVAMDQSGNVTLYKDGVIVAQKKLYLPQNLVRNQNYLGKSNWSGDAFFNGQMDEVRLWNRCRSQSEIKAALNQRLVGDEPGLWAYYRFDEGLGDRLHDQTENAMHASIQGATWVKSDAPIGDHPGLQRTSFSLKSGSDERQIASGLASVLYHQQEKVATGYDQQEKPVKRNARVMLTVGTSNSATPDQNFIAALDFAVSREGKIAQAPDCLTLPSLQKGNAANTDLDAVSRLQEEISTLKASINQLEISISALRASNPRIATLEAQKARLATEVESLENDLKNKKQSIFSYLCRIRFNNNSGYLEADNSCNLSYQGEADRPGQYWEIGSGYSGGSNSLCPSNHLTTGSDYNVYFQRIPGRRGLASSESGSLSLDSSPFSMSAAWWFNNSQYTYDSSGTTLVVDALVRYGNGQVLFNGKLTLTKTNRSTSVITNAENAISSKRVELSNTTSELNKLYGDRTKLQEQESELALSKVQLENKETTLELARSGVQGEVALPMSWLHTDPCGLTVAGGLLNFAYTQDTPLLVNGATGNVALYFRGVNDQFFVTYYDTNTTKAQHLLEAETGKLMATARSAEPECDHATFTISDSDNPETCTLTITNSATKLEETWQHLPRDVEQFCNILNGGAREPIFIGKLERSVSGEAVNSLTLSQRPKQSLAPGSILSVGNRKVVVTGTQSKTTDSLSALQLNGANTYVEVPYFSALNTNEFTISLWAKLEGGQGHRSPLTSRNNSPTQGYIFYASPSNQWEFWVGNGGGWDIVSSSDIALNVWNHLAATLRGNHLKLYVNGKLVAEKTIGNYSLNNGKPLRIGAGGTEGNPDYLFPGQIDEVQIWNKARSENEIQGDMNRRLTGNEPGLMGYWQFTGGSAKDYSPNGHHGQIFGQPSTVASAIQDKIIDGSKESVETIAIAPISLGIPADAAVYLIPYDYEAWTSNNRTSNSLDQGSLQFIFQPGSSSGKVQNGTITGDDTTLSCQWVAESPGRALSFDGQNDYVKLADSAKLSKFDAKGDLTLEAWVRSAQLAESARVIHHHSANSQYTLGVQSKGSNSLSAIEFDGVDDYIELPAACIPTGNEITISFWAFGGSKLPKRNSILAAYSANNGKVLEIHFPWDNRVIYFDCGDGRGSSYDRIEKLAQDSEFKGAWSHWAFTKNVATGEMKIYLNGKLWHSGTGKTIALGQAKTLLVGGGHSWGGYYNGSFDELQIWNKVRSEAEIQGDMNRRLTGNEPGLMGYWQFTGGIAKDYSPNGYHGQIFGKPAIVASAIQDKQIYGFAGVGNLFLKSKESAPLAQWHHLSAVYNQSYALQFKGNGFLECDHNPTLDLDRDLSIEVFLQVGSLNQPQGILTKGKLADGTTQNVPYSLYLDTDGKIAFAFEDKQGKSYVYKSRDALQVGQFYKIAVTRQHQIEVKNQGSAEAPNVIVNQWADIRFYIAQKAAGYDVYKGADLDRNSQKLEIGKTYQGSQPSYFQGFISEVRLWNTVVDLANLGMKINGQEKGLIAWWRLEENEGNIASDSKGESHAVIIAAQWIKNPDPQGSSLTLYQNGLPVPTESFTPQNNWGEQQFALGGIYRQTGLPLEPFAGIMEEVRIWKVARTQEQIQDNLFSRIKGEKQDLIANYTFDLESQTELFDQSLMGNHLTLGVNESKPTSVLSTAPISQDTAIIRSALAGVKTQFHETIHSSPAVQEYSDLQYDIEGNLIGIQKRCYGYIKNGQWNLLTGYKVGNLITEWIGQVQADPQIIGYIEGAPPVPSENLTGEDPYNETSIQLVEADSVNYIYSSSKESGFDMSMETVARLGLSQSTSGGIGLETQIAEVTSFIGGKATFESSQGSVDEASVSYGYNTTKVSRLQTLGTREKIGSELNPYVGRRYVPNNVGLALVQSDTMDVFALRLAHNNALVSYRFLPNPDIPKDWNIITFPINPTYTKQGTLDGKIGLKEDGSVQADPHYPNAATYGQWSYFKPIEAYSLKKRIERQRQELATYYDQYSTFQNVSFQASGTLGELPSQKMATRNLVNTHVWTADGGFFSESTDVMEATSETTTGNYSFQGMAGLSIDLNVKVVTAVSLQLDALFGGHVATTKTKGRETEKSFAVEVEMAVERDIQLRANTETLKTKYHGQFDPEELGVYDAQGNPIKQPGKVDAYRFMTFYFEPTTENFEDFFGKVVDPIWLEQSSEPNAIALRQANQGDKKPSCWRIFHRVTFVSRILPEIAAQNAPPLEKAIRAANIESNWELIKKLEPFVQTKTQDFVTFADAVRTAIATYLPELQGYESSVIQYMALYYGLNEVV